MHTDEYSIGCYVVSANYGRFLTDCLDSILNQKRLPDTIILVDVGSTDETVKIYSTYSNYFNKLGIKCEMLLLDKLNLLQVIDLVLPNLHDDFIFRLDADDVLLPDFVHDAWHTISQKAGNLDLLYTGYNKTDELGNIISYEPASKLTCLSTPAHGACTLLSQKLIKKINKYTNFGVNGQDGLISWAMCHKYNFSSSFIQQPLFNYRQHGNSLSSGAVSFARKRIAVLRKILNNRVKKGVLNYVISVNSSLSNNQLEQLFLTKLQDDWFNKILHLFPDFKKFKIIVFCSSAHEFLLRQTLGGWTEQILNCKASIVFSSKEGVTVDHFNEFLQSDGFNAHVNGDVVTSNFLIEDLSKTRLSDDFYELINLYFDERFNKKFIATGKFSHKVQIQFENDFGKVHINEDLRKISAPRAFCFEKGVFAISQGAYLNNRTFIPVVVENEPN